MKKLDPNKIPKFVSPLFRIPIWKPQNYAGFCKHNCCKYHKYTVSIVEFKQQILPPNFPKTKIYGFEGYVHCANRAFRSSPGATFEAIKDIPIVVHWQNKIRSPYTLPVDPTIHWANPNNMPMPEPPFLPFPPGYPLAQKDVPIAIHLHGGEVPSYSDGYPESWFTANEQKVGPQFTTAIYNYPNQQEATTLWYHDHALGVTRLNVYAGLAGFYLIREKNDNLDYYLPPHEYEIPLIIQDKSFYVDGSLYFPSDGNDPEVHPYWTGFSGDVMTVNGVTWPNLNVQRRQYRFRILNGSLGNSYTISLSNGDSFIQIGSDGGYLPSPVELTELSLTPAERADILIDFSKVKPDTRIILRNIITGCSPQDPMCHINDDDPTASIMQFTVSEGKAISPPKLPSVLNEIPKLKPNRPKRILTLVRQFQGEKVVADLLNGQPWEDPTTEVPIVGSTEIWELVNITAGSTHPIHIHLVQFQVLNRQNMDSPRYLEDWLALNGPLPYSTKPKEIDPKPYLIGDVIPPPLNERGWKDTVAAYPNQVLRLIVRFTPQRVSDNLAKPGINLFPFDPTKGPGYVWHCHIIPHEDNSMMRPMIIRKLKGQ